MSGDDDRDPPDSVEYTVEEALTLLAALEDAREALIDSRYFVMVVYVEAEIQLLSRRLGYVDPEGDPDGS